mgnify:CR=1 FL=1
MTVEWKGDEFRAAMRAAVARGLNAVAIEAEGIARTKIQAAQVVRVENGLAIRGRSRLASSPGEYPRSQTGSLRNSLTTQSATPQELSAAFGVFGGTRGVARRVAGSGALGYPFYLERGTSRMRPRPWANRTINENRSRLQRVFVQEAGRGIGGAVR